MKKSPTKLNNTGHHTHFSELFSSEKQLLAHNTKQIKCMAIMNQEAPDALNGYSEIRDPGPPMMEATWDTASETWRLKGRKLKDEK